MTDFFSSNEECISEKSFQFGQPKKQNKVPYQELTQTKKKEKTSKERYLEKQSIFLFLHYAPKVFISFLTEYNTDD